MVRNILLVILTSVLLIGCEAPKQIVTLDPLVACEEIIHPALQKVPFDDLVQGQEQAEEWILTNFPTATVSFEPSQDDGFGGIGRFSWSVGEKNVDLHLYSTTRYLDQTSRAYPLLGQLLHCFGAPKYYSLEEAPMGIEARGMGVRLELW